MKEILDLKQIFSSKLFNVNLAEVKTETGNILEKIFIEPLLDCVGAVVVRNKKIILIKTKRLLTDKSLWELPGGWMRDGELALAAIRRKVEEETGFEVTNINRLGTTLKDIGLSTKEIFYFYVEVGDRALAFNQDLVEKVGAFSLKQIQKLVQLGEISDERTLSALFLAEKKGFIE